MTSVWIEAGILLPALVTGLLVLSTHVPLGEEVLRRGIIFIDLAIAQIAGLGVIAAARFGWEAHGWEVQLAAMFSALLGAVLMSWMEKHWQQQLEALIGTTFILAATAGILLLANHPHGGEHLRELLVGQILWTNWSQLLYPAIVSVCVLVVWFGFRKHLGRVGFYFVFALSITVSVQLVGVYLVFASLIIPALASTKLRFQNSLWTGYIIGTFGYIMGLLTSAWLDLPGGAMTVWGIALVALFSVILLPRISPTH